MSAPDSSEVLADSVSRSLTRRLLLLSLIGVLGLGSALTLGLMWTLQQVQNRLDGINLAAVGDFDRFFLDIERDLQSTSDGLSARADKDTALLSLWTRNRTLLDAFVFGPNGSLLAQRNALGRPRQSTASKPEWLRSPPPFGEVAIGPVQFEGNTPFVDMAIVTTDDISLPSGLLLVRADLTALWNATLDIKVGETGYAYIADSAGQLVAFRNRRLLGTGRDLERLVGRRPEDIVAAGLSLYTGLCGDRVLASARRLNAVPWFAVVEQPAREAFAPFARVVLLLLLALGVVGLLLIDTIRFTSSRIISPLLTLRDAVLQMSGGRLKQGLEIRKRDELGQLTRAFNGMAEQREQAFLDRERQIDALRVAQAAQGESETRFRRLFEKAPLPLALVDHDGVIAYINERFVEIFGYSAKEVSTTDEWWPRAYPDAEYRRWVVETWDGALRRAVAAGGDIDPIEYSVTCRNGDVRIVEISGTPMGRAVLVTFIDRTERKRSEEALRTTLKRFELILAALYPGILVVNEQDRVEFANQAVCDLFDLQGGPERLLGLEAPALVTIIDSVYSDPALATARIGEIVAAGQPVKDEEISITHDRTYVRDFIPIIIDGKNHGRVWHHHDITGRKRAEQAHARLATVVEQASEAIVITDTHGVIGYVNPAFEKTTGFSSAEVKGHTPRLLRSGKHDLEFYRGLWSALERGEIWTGRFINRRKDGRLYEDEATISPVRDATGKIVNYLSVQRDVSREVQLEAQLRQSQKMEAIGQLAGGVAHDFNNLLTTLIMQTEMLSDVENLPAEVLDGLKDIRADADRAAELTRQLLLFSRRQVMQLRDLNLNEVVTNVSKMLGRIIGEDVRLELQLHHAPLILRADAGMLEQVLMNLAVNARDAMLDGGRLRIETGEVIVDAGEAALDPEATPGRYARLSVSDTGDGIPADVLPRIFEPFFTTKEAGKGTGLGLATVFGIVKQHRGWIRVDNNPGHGVEFHVHLPATAAKVVSQVQPVPARAKVPQPGGAECILLVEDEAAVRRLTRRILERSGYQVLEAANGPEALEVWRKHGESVALLLTDMVMPAGVSGQELARRLLLERPGLKVVFASGYSADIAGRELRLRSGENFVQKPFTADGLLETIRRSLDGTPRA